MAQYEFTGTVKKILPVFNASSGFSKQEIVVTSEDDRYPQDVVFEFVKEKMALLEDIREADRVRLSFDLRGREYNERFFVNLSGWRIEKLDGSGSSAAASDDAMPADNFGTPPDLDDPDALGDDLPF